MYIQTCFLLGRTIMYTIVMECRNQPTDSLVSVVLRFLPSVTCWPLFVSKASAFMWWWWSMYVGGGKECVHACSLKRSRCNYSTDEGAQERTEGGEGRERTSSKYNSPKYYATCKLLRYPLDESCRDSCQGHAHQVAEAPFKYGTSVGI